MPANKNFYRRSHRSRRLHDGLGDARPHWGRILGAAGLLIALITAIFFLVRGCASQDAGDGDSPLEALADSDPVTFSTPSDYVDEGPYLDGSSEERAIDMSQDFIIIQSKERNINQPGIYGDELVYSAGTGALDKPVLKTLYLYDLKTGEEKEIATVTVKDGEIYETYINTDYIVWLDTDQQGTNSLFFMRRNDTSVLDGAMLGDLGEEPDSSDEAPPSPDADPSASPSASVSPSASASPSAAPESPAPPVSMLNVPIPLKESAYHMPMLRLSGDRLIWNEKDGDGFEVLNVVDLIGQEPVSLPGYTESIEGFEEAYAVSAPDIHGNEIIWSAPDPDDPDGRKSAIYSCDLEQLMLDESYRASVWKADMFVNDPLTNGKAWAWTDTYHEPVQSLFVRYNGQVTPVTTSTLDSILSNYCLGDDMLVYTKGGHIWVYFYETGIYGRVTEDDEVGKQPVTYGRRVVWFTDSVDGKDQLKVVYIP